jgi:hypothetical protein
MSVIDIIFGKSKVEPKPIVKVDNSNEICEYYEPKTFTCKEYVENLYKMMMPLCNFTSDDYKLSYKFGGHGRYDTSFIEFEAINKKIKIKLVDKIEEIVRECCSGTERVYSIESIKFKDELIYYDGIWLCHGAIEQGVYDILNDFTQLIEKIKEIQTEKENEKYRLNRLEQKKRCEQINKEFLELKGALK